MIAPSRVEADDSDVQALKVSVGHNQGEWKIQLFTEYNIVLSSMPASPAGYWFAVVWQQTRLVGSN